MHLKKIIIFSFWIITFYFLLQYANPLQINSGLYKYNKTSNFFPQGWGFFTRNPQEELVDVYTFDHNNLQKVENKSFSSANRFGLSKDIRHNLIEIGNFYELLKSGRKWHSHKGFFDNQYIAKLKTDTITVKDSKRYDAGFKILKRKKTYIITRYKPIPFAWSNNNQQQFNNYEVLKVYIK